MQRLRMRVAEELRGNSASLRRASKRSSISRASLLAIARSAFRFSAYRATRALRWLFFSTALFFAMVTSPYPSLEPNLGELGKSRYQTYHFRTADGPSDINDVAPRSAPVP